MVGLNHLGEAAWAVEQVMNKWLQDDPLAPALMHLISDVASGFCRLGGGNCANGSALSRPAHFQLPKALKNGQEPAVLPTGCRAGRRSC